MIALQATSRALGSEGSSARVPWAGEHIEGADAAAAGRAARRLLLGATIRESPAEAGFPNLPGHVRAVIPEIRSIAGSAREFLLLVELAKSAQTGNLIGSVLTAGVDVEARVGYLCERKNKPAFKKRLARALTRFERAARARGLD